MWNNSHRGLTRLQTSTFSSAASASRLTGWSHSITCDSAGGSDWPAGPCAVCSVALHPMSVSPLERGEPTLSAARRICGEAGCGAEAAGTSWQGGGSVWGGWSGGGVVAPDAWSAGEPVSDMVTCKIDIVVIPLFRKFHLFSILITNESFHLSVVLLLSKPQFIDQWNQDVYSSNMTHIEL